MQVEREPGQAMDLCLPEQVRPLLSQRSQQNRSAHSHRGPGASLALRRFFDPESPRSGPDRRR
jgi:hypothetical protein